MGSRIEIPRVTVSNGTYPEGSEWARNPIPACRTCPKQYEWNRTACAVNADCGGCCSTVATGGPGFGTNSTWWRQQVCYAESAGNGLSSCPPGQTQFPEPMPGLSGFFDSYQSCGARNKSHGQLGDGPYEVPCSNATFLEVNVVDHVQIPADLEPGNYLLSWRWDCEQTYQVWQNCADVTINDGADSV